MKEFLILGAALLIQNVHASVPSWRDTTPEIVREKINQRIMSIEAPTPAVWSVEDRIAQESECVSPPPKTKKRVTLAFLFLSLNLSFSMLPHV